MATAKSPIDAASPHMNHDRGYGPASYFPQSQSQQYNSQQPQPYYVDGNAAPDAETLSNTLANSHVTQNDRDYGAHLIAPVATRPTKFNEEWDASQRGSSIIDGPGPTTNMHRSSSVAGSVNNNVTSDGAAAVSRSNTLKKKASLRRSGSLKRSGSRRSMKAGSVRSLALQATTDHDEMNSAFYCPVPTAGNPTEVLANRFQSWRKILKDLITYFKEIQTHYEHRSKSLLKLSNVLNNTATPPGFLASGGLDDALQMLRSYNKLAISESNKAREIEEDVILALTGLRSDLHQKIKEIKNLSGDFKNSVEKEMDATRKAVNNLQEVLGQTELDPALTTGKQDPYLLRLAVDRQLERQIDEENYLHQAYLNLENSGRELESIVVGEIQKSYNAYAGILKREADAAYTAIEELRAGPISIPKDTEWTSFVQRDDRFVDPEVPIRTAEYIHYPGRDHTACQEIRAGLLERKSKYLKSYSAGWYVLSPTHLHEFKSADKTQAPVMSLYLPEQKLGSHSTEGGSSNKFILKGRQTGGMHRGHTWVFRAESHDTMMAWYEDIKALTEKTPEERSNFLRGAPGHGRSFSRTSQRSSMSSDGGVEDDDQEPPFTASMGSLGQQNPQLQQQHFRQDGLQRRPSGGRFPSDIQVNAQRGLQVPVSPLSVSSGNNDHIDGDVTTASGMPGTGGAYRQQEQPYNGVQQHQYQPADYRATAATGTQYGLDGDADVFSSRNKHPNGATGDQYNQQQSSPNHGRQPPPVAVAITTGASQKRRDPSEDGNHHTTTGGVQGSTWDGQRQLDGHIAVDGNANGQYEKGGDHHPRTTAASAAVPTGSFDGGTEEGVASDDDLISQDSISVNGKLKRPVEGAQVRTDSVPTISHLHIPGEYPKDRERSASGNGVGGVSA